MDVTVAQLTARLSASGARPMSNASTDSETTRLANEARAGSVDAFCALIELHQRAARRVAAVALADSADVDDAVQDACLTAWQRITHLSDPAAFRAWLLKITWRKALDRRRSIGAWLKRFKGAVAGSHAATSRDAGSEHDIDARVADSALLVEQQMVAAERDRIVAQLIQSLPARLRDPFLMAASGEHRYEDIADVLGMPVGTVKWRVSEARRVLRSKLQRMGF